MPFPNSQLVQSGRFSEIRAIGRGACGQVYVARDNLGRMVAVKEALPSDEEFAWVRSKFQKEARIQAALQHPNIVAIYSLEEDRETRELYLICEYASGGSLADYLEALGCVPEALAITIARDICGALEATWRQLIVHRDVKPSNILLVKDAQNQIIAAKLGDFGVAQDQRLRRTTLLPGVGHPGTPLYMPPEQGNIATVLDVRADIYALGVTLWEMQTGRDLKLLPSNQETGDLQAQRPRLSPGMAAVIERATHEDREQRYFSPTEMANELAAVRDGAWAPARATIALPRARHILARHSAPIERAPRQSRGAIALALLALLVVAPLAFWLGFGLTKFSSAPAKTIEVDNPKALAAKVAPACLKQQLAFSEMPTIAVGPPVPAPADSRNMAKGGQLVSHWEVESQAEHIVFSPDGQTFATALSDGTVQLRSASGKPLRTLCMPADGDPNVAAIAFAPDGQTLATASGDGTIQIWRVSNGTLERTLAMPVSGVAGIAFAPNGQMLAASTDKGSTLQLFSADDPKPLRTILLNTNGAVAIVFSPDSQTLAVGYISGAIELWSVADSKLLFRASQAMPAGQAPGLAFAPDGQTLAVGLADGTVQIRRLDGTIAQVVDGQVGLTAQPAFAPDGQILAAARSDGRILLWQVGDGALLRTLEGRSTKGHASLAFSPDGQNLAAAWETGAIELWSAPP
jgi:hypothetical protein